MLLSKTFENQELHYFFIGIIIQFTILAIIFYFVEKIKPVEPKTPYFKKDFSLEALYMNLNDAFFAPFITLLITFLFTHSLYLFLPHQLFAAEIAVLPFALQIFLASVYNDFFIYWRHRFTHHYWWPYHAMHHSAEQLSWLTKGRLHPLDLTMAIAFSTFGLYIAGFSDEVIYYAMIVNTCVDYFSHANLDVNLKKPWCYLINNPRFHRWHHANMKEAYNKNFCSTYPFIDLLFGTYHFPEDRMPDKYGILPKEQAQIPATYLGHLIHPLRVHGRKIVKFFSNSPNQKS